MEQEWEEQQQQEWGEEGEESGQCCKHHTQHPSHQQSQQPGQQRQPEEKEQQEEEGTCRQVCREGQAREEEEGRSMAFLMGWSQTCWWRRRPWRMRRQPCRPIQTQQTSRGGEMILPKQRGDSELPIKKILGSLFPRAALFCKSGAKSGAFA